MANEETGDRNAKSFATFLASIEAGTINDDLSRKLRDLIGDMSNHAADYGAAKGKLQITIDFALDEKVMSVSTDVKVTPPKDKKGKDIFWITPENDLSRQDPRQRRFDFAGDKKGNVQTIPTTA